MMWDVPLGEYVYYWRKLETILMEAMGYNLSGIDS